MSHLLVQMLSRHLRHGTTRVGGLVLQGLSPFAGVQAGRKHLFGRRREWATLTLKYCSGTSSHWHHKLPQAEDNESHKTSLTPPSTSHHPVRSHLPSLPHESVPDFPLPSQRLRYESDLLLVRIQDCHSTSTALELYQKHKEVLNTRHTLAIMRKLEELITSGSEDQAELLQAEDFEDLCHKLFLSSRQMEVDELVSLLRYLCRLEVPPDSKLTQTVLQMLKHQVNDLSLRQLIFMDFLLRKMPLTSLSDALLTAIPILVDASVTPHQLADLPLSELTQVFNICCYGRVHQTSQVLREIYRRGSVQGVSSAMSVVWSLCELSPGHLRRRLLSQDDQLTREVLMKECLETLAKDISSISSQQVESTLTKVCEGYQRRDRCCYNEHFLQAVADNAIQRKLSFEKVAHILRKTLNVYYLPENLVHYAVDLVLEEPWFIPEAKTGILPLIIGIAATPSLHEDKLKMVLDTLMKHKSLRLDTADYFKKPLVMIALELLSMGYVHPHLMELLTTPDSLSIYMSKYPKDNINHKRLLEMDQVLEQVFHSSMRVPEAFLEPGRAVVREQLPSRSSLKVMLQEILQGPDKLVSGVVTENDMYLDHLLVLDSEGFPVTLKPNYEEHLSNISITSLDIPQDSTKIAIMDIGSSNVFKPTNALKGSIRLRQRVLEANGFTVVGILQSVVYQYHEEEKFLYIKRELMEAGVMFKH